MKRCRKCGEDKPAVEFHRWSRAPDGLKPRCKSCNTSDATAWQSRNREKAGERMAKWARENRPRVREIHAAYRSRNAESERVRLRAIAKARPDVCAARCAKRRAKKRSATPAWADEAAIRVMYRKASGLRMEVDHIVPLQSDIVCGLHVPTNLQLLTKPLNSAKMNRHWPDMP